MSRFISQYFYITGPHHTVLWRNQTHGLYTGSIKQTNDPRINKLPNNTLEIRQVSPYDSGRYSCQVPVQTVVEITHTIHVLSECEHHN